MNDLRLLGTKEVCGIEVPEIEGGFGEGKRAMLAKDIASLHSKPLFKLNELVENNMSRFKTGIDLIDLMGTDFLILLRDNEIISQNAINRSEHIYIFSERGYAKLLKIFDDDLAWERYDQVLDDYFEIRSKVRGTFRNRVSFKEQIEVIPIIANDLKINEGSRIAMYQKVYEANGVSHYHLPAYTDEKITMSLTELIKDRGLKISAQALNVLLVDKGLLEEVSRPSTKTENRVKKYKRLTDAGLRYGKNLINPQNQKETQPHYYPDTFGELLNLCGVLSL